MKIKIPASKEFRVTLGNEPVYSGPINEELLLDIPNVAVVSEVMEDPRALERALNALWSTEDESPIIGTIKPKR
jgi:hypothetical protein